MSISLHSLILIFRCLPPAVFQEDHKGPDSVCCAQYYRRNVLEIIRYHTLIKKEVKENGK